MLLNDVHERDGTDLFVATYSVYKRQDGSLFSVSVWSDGVRSLLPETDIVALHRGSTGQSAYVPMAELLRTCGDLMTATGHRPVRRSEGISGRHAVRGAVGAVQRSLMLTPMRGRARAGSRPRNGGPPCDADRECKRSDAVRYPLSAHSGSVAARAA